MKKLILVRHAKSSWDVFGQTDFDRPLNDRGKKDAPMMAQRLLQKNIIINAFISSPALRAKTTAAYFAKAFTKKESDIVLVQALYHAPPTVFVDVIKHLHNDLETVIVFAHNPGITDFINTLTTIRIDDMPTCGVFALTIQSQNWKDFETAEKTFLFFDYPKAG